MKIFLIILMFIVTIYGIAESVDKGQVAYIGDTKIKRGLTAAACIAIAIIVATYNLACVYILLRVI